MRHLPLRAVARPALAAGLVVILLAGTSARLPRFAEPTTGALAVDGFPFIADSRVTAVFERPDPAVLTGFGRAHGERVGVERAADRPRPRHLRTP